MDKFIIFDLDGTLINTIKGITKALNVFLNDFNYNIQYSDEEVEKFIGNGARKLYMLALNKNYVDEEEYKTFMDYYIKFQNSSPIYNGVIDALNELKNRGYKLIVYSNKPDYNLQLLIKDKFDNNLFTYIQGQDNNYPLKPDPTIMNKIIKDFNLDKDKGYFVGDSYVDVIAAKNLNIKSIYLTYGYGDNEVAKSYKPDYIFNEFSNLLEVLK